MKAMIYVQHLLGSGHAVRAAALAGALGEAGVRTALVTGNRLPPAAATGGFEIVDLPHARTTRADFSEIVDAEGMPIDETWKARRRDALLAAFADIAPDILVTETWPFGRNAFAFELQPLLEAALSRPRRPLLAASIRDILVRKETIEKERRMADRARASYDLVLVHGDPRFVALDASFPFAGEIADLLRYTGYIHTGVAAPEPPGDEGRGEIVVSCGGGAVGHELLRLALAAPPLTRERGLTWRVLVGSDMADEVLAGLRAAAPGGVIVERARRDFPNLLKRARLSVSQCGYNTAMDVLSAGCGAVFVPFARGVETEQTQRAEALAARGVAVIVPEQGLTAETLAAAVDRALRLDVPPVALAADGARKSARILLDAARRHFGGAA